MAKVDGDCRDEGEMFRAEIEVIENDRVHGFGLAAARHHADGGADVQVQGLRECVVDAEASRTAVENSVSGLPVQRDGHANEIVLEMKLKLSR